MQFIENKFQVPTINHELVPRSHLYSRLSNGLNSRLLLICAPAGFGKTMLAAGWLAEQNIAKAWISIDENDNDPVNFLGHIATVLSRALQHMENSALSLFDKKRVPSVSTLLVHLINNLAVEDQNCILVLDDFQMISEPAIFDIMTLFIDRLPNNTRIVITTRNEPDLPVSRLRARGQLTEITADDLRFTTEETHTFVNRIMGLKLDADEIALLTERTEGWVTGLQLAALSASSSLNPSRLLRTLSGRNRYICDYFFDEVLSQQPEEIHWFLMQTSILERFCAELCNEILGIKESQSILNTLENDNLFIFALDTTRTWYRYHHLFAQLLQFRFEQQDPEKIKDTYMRAGRWHYRNGLTGEAIEYNRKGRHYEQIDKIAETFWNDPTAILAVDQREKINQALNHLPDSILNASMKLSLIRALFGLMSGKIGSSENLFRKISASSPRQSSSHHKGRLISSIGLAIIACHRYWDGRTTCLHAEEVLQFLKKKGSHCFFTQYIFARGLLLSGDTKRALEHLNLLMNDHSLQMAPFKLSLLASADVCKAKGQLSEALSIYQQVHDLGFEQTKVADPGYCSKIIGQARIYYERGETDICEELLAIIADVIVETDYLDLVLEFYNISIDLYCASNNLEKARHTLQRVTEIVTSYSGPPNAVRRIEVLRAHLSLAEEDIDQAVQCAGTIRAGVKNNTGYDVEPELISLACIHLARKEFTQAMALLDPMIELASKQERLNSVIKLETLAAKVCFVSGDDDKGLARLQQALTLARPEGYMRTFVDEGAPIQALLQMFFEKNLRQTDPDRLSGYIKNLLQQFEPAAEPPSLEHSSGQEKAGSNLDLTRREHQVLGLIAKGLTYKEVAEQLALSINTVRFHVKNLYSKLNVNSRFLAVRAAKSLKDKPGW